MKKRNTFLIFLLCLAALIVLSGCASRNADTAAPSEPHEATSVSTPPETPADAEETPTYADTKEQPIVTMTIWSYDVDKEFAYTLTPEDSSRVIAIFEGAEKEPLDSPIADFTELYFQFGENHLAAPLSDFDPFRGMLDGERVVFTLDEESCDTLREIIRGYTDLDTPAAGLDTPSAGEE